MASVICISLPLFVFKDLILLKIDLGKIYLPITALFDGAFFLEGFSITPSIIKFLTSNDTGPRYLSKADFDEYNIEVLFEDDESGAFRNALKSYGILSD